MTSTLSQTESHEGTKELIARSKRVELNGLRLAGATTLAGVVPTAGAAALEPHLQHRARFTLTQLVAPAELGALLDRLARLRKEASIAISHPWTDLLRVHQVRIVDVKEPAASRVAGAFEVEVELEGVA